MSREMTRQTMMQLLDLKDRKNFRENYLNPAIDKEWIEMTNPNAKGGNKSYRLTRPLHNDGLIQSPRQFQAPHTHKYHNLTFGYYHTTKNRS
jgi:hypothetical protein